MSTQFDELELISSVCRESFYEFFKEFWEEIIQEELILNWHIRYLCDQMQDAAERVFKGEPRKKDVIINVSPGSTKSTICSVMFPAWVLTRMPHARCICVSHTDSLVMDLSRKCRDVVRSEKYQACFGVVRKFKGVDQKPVAIRNDQDTKGYWATSQGGMRFCATIQGKTPIGMHGHFMIVDDPIDPQKIFSEQEINQANRYMNETLPGRRIDKQVSVLFLIMQRLHQDDPTGNRLANRKAEPVKHICLPAEDAFAIKPSYLKKYYSEGLFDSVRLPRTALEKELGLNGEFAYSGQYGQSPIPLGGGMFKVSRINFDTPPTQFLKVVRYWDTAGSLKGAYTAGVKMGRDMRGKLWVLHVKRGRWAPEEREAIIQQMAKLDGKNVHIGIEQQPGSSGKEVVEDTVKKLMGYRSFPDRPTGDKTHRAEPFAGQMNVGNVYLPLVQEWAQDYLDELQYFPASRFRDQVDASSGAMKFLAARVVVGGVRGM